VRGKANAIDRIQGAFKELQLAVHDLPDERMTEPWFGEWSTKDLLAHMASWDEFAAADLRRVGRGHVPCLAAFKSAEIDQWNEFFMKPRWMWPLVQVRFESEHSHGALVESLNALPESMFAEGHMVAAHCGIAAYHYEEHITHIRDRHHVASFRREHGA
jgi:hypothetical protein